MLSGCAAVISTWARSGRVGGILPSASQGDGGHCALQTAQVQLNTFWLHWASWIKHPLTYSRCSFFCRGWKYESKVIFLNVASTRCFVRPQRSGWTGCCTSVLGIVADVPISLPYVFVVHGYDRTSPVVCVAHEHTGFYLCATPKYWNGVVESKIQSRNSRTGIGAEGWPGCLARACSWETWPEEPWGMQASRQPWVQATLSGSVHHTDRVVEARHASLTTGFAQLFLSCLSGQNRI